MVIAAQQRQHLDLIYEEIRSIRLEHLSFQKTLESLKSTLEDCKHTTETLTMENIELRKDNEFQYSIIYNIE